MTSHHACTSSRLVKVGANLTTDSGVVSFWWKDHNDRDRKVMGFLNVTGLSLHEVPNDGPCPKAPSASRNTSMWADDNGVDECEYRTEAVRVIVELAETAGNTAIRDILTSRPTVDIVVGNATAPEPDTLEWVWDPTSQWHLNPSTAPLSMDGFTWPELPFVLDPATRRLLEGRIPEVDPFYVPNTPVIESIMYGIFGMSYEVGGKNVLLEGAAGTGKDAAFRHAAAILGAPYHRITVSENTNGSKLFASETLADGSGHARMGVVLEALSFDQIFVIEETNRMQESMSAEIYAVQTAIPGVPVCFPTSQGDVWFTRAPMAVFGGTQNVNTTKHTSVHNQGPAFRRRNHIVTVEIDETVFSQGIRNRIKAMNSAMVRPPGVTDKQLQTTTSEKAEVAIKLLLTLRGDDEMQQHGDWSIPLGAKLAHAAAFLGWDRALKSTVLGQVPDPFTKKELLDFITDEFGEPFSAVALSDADL